MYSIKKSDIIGTVKEPEEDYDLMNVIIIRRGKETKEPIFDYLSGVFGCDKGKISKYVDIAGNEKVYTQLPATSCTSSHLALCKPLLSSALYRLIRVATNRCLDVHRGRNRHPTVHITLCKSLLPSALYRTGFPFRPVI